MLTRCLIAVCAALAAGVSLASAEDPDEYEVWETVGGGEPCTAITAIEPEPAAVAEATELCSSIMGEQQVDAETLCRFVKRHNPDFEPEIAETFVRLGKVYGIRGDVAMCQAIIETGWFKFADGTAVRPEQHNYCGLGVTKRGVKGHAFDSVEDGVRAHLQHLYAYACTAPLPKNEPLTDPRFKLVKRGAATTWEELSNRWAMNPNYGKQIMRLYGQLLELSATAER